MTSPDSTAGAPLRVSDQSPPKDPVVYGPLVDVNFSLPHHRALALAQFVKRVGWTEIRLNAADDDEAAVMRHAIEDVQEALREAGYAPR